MTMNIPESRDTERAALNTPSDLSPEATATLADSINRLVADAYVLYVKTKNFHWHVSGPNFRDFHEMLDEQSEQILESIDPLAERVRKLGQPTLKSLGQILELASLRENQKDFVSPYEMLVELMNDNISIAKSMREAHGVCDDWDDVATSSLIEQYLDETEKRTWFLFEAARAADSGGH
ncbi:MULTISPECIES: DNA starvation/stationary phase protection protein [Methylocystis]|uniref:Dps family protein n=1 Tax=Methylocystis TaxID=133 RepID=UPI0024B9174F|nr:MULTISPECIES: DNA starvation/stationary phase protection protein [Methylocystis]MDJ0449558.1 DNA starvation/stationary phase protection protein [Methylocystis sp. JR02]